MFIIYEVFNLKCRQVLGSLHLPHNLFFFLSNEVFARCYYVNYPQYFFFFLKSKRSDNNSCKQRLSPHQRELEERLRSISAQEYQQDLNTSSYEIVTFCVLISTIQKSYLTLLLYTLALNVRTIPLTYFYLCHL